MSMIRKHVTTNNVTPDQAIIADSVNTGATPIWTDPGARARGRDVALARETPPRLHFSDWTEKSLLLD